MLEWEEFRLLQWAERAGIHKSEGNHKINWSLAEELLGQLLSDLDNVTNLKDKYHLNPEPEGDGQEAAVSDGTTASFSSRLRSHTTEPMRRLRKRAIDTASLTYKRLRWVKLDQDRIRELISHVTYFNNCLQSLLDTAQQEFVHAGMAALLHDLVSRSSSNLDLDVVQALLDPDSDPNDAEIRPAILLKNTRLMVDVDKRDGEKWIATSQRGDLIKIRFEKLASLADCDRPGWQTAIYNATPRKNVYSYVLVEWKSVPKTLDKKFAARIHSLTFLLSNTPPGFRSLRCLGFVKREMPGDTNKYAYVFELVDFLRSPGTATAPPKPLSAVIGAIPSASLTKRIALCLKIAQFLLQLHSAGWLHKNISAGSILFLDIAGKSLLSNASGPFVCGFEFARNSAEETEAMDDDNHTELYRHPDYLHSSPTSKEATRYRKAYDLYSLGCVLLEVALWSDLEEILYLIGKDSAPASLELEEGERSAGQLAHERRLVVLRGRKLLLDKGGLGKVGERVAFYAGDQMRQAIELCFFPKNLVRAPVGEGNSEGDTTDDEDHLEVSVATQVQIVNLIRSIRRV